MGVKKFLDRYPFNRIYEWIRYKKFKNSGAYWEKRYASGGTSGRGSYGKLAEYKADYINSFVAEHNISSVIELGCGDGNQLTLARYPKYTGLDISKTAIKKCTALFSGDNSKKFYLYGSSAFDLPGDTGADLSMSLDVIYHLIEPAVYEKYMHDLFDASSKYVIIYAWDGDVKTSPHVLHRNFTKWVTDHKPEWSLIRVNGVKKPDEACDFFVYKKN